MKTVLILVLSAEMEPYPALREAALRTWDSGEQHAGAFTVYYSAGGDTAPRVLQYPGPDGLFEMGRKDLFAYEWALQNRSWDYLARVNASCYVRKAQVLAAVQSLPATGVFRGVGADHVRGRYLWGGAQFILSRDVVAALVLNGHKWDHAEMEDVAMSRLVKELGFQFDEHGDAASLNRQPAGAGWVCLRYVDGGMRNFEFKDFAEVKEQIGGCPFIRVKQDGARGDDGWVMEQLHKHQV